MQGLFSSPVKGLTWDFGVLKFDPSSVNKPVTSSNRISIFHLFALIHIVYPLANNDIVGVDA